MVSLQQLYKQSRKLADAQIAQEWASKTPELAG